MKIDIKLRSDYRNTKPICKIYSKKNTYQIAVENEQIFTRDFDIDERDTLNIEFTNKDGVDDNVVYIDQVSVDDINLQHFIYEGEFFPEYAPDWLKEQKELPPSSYKPCTELRLKGTWKLQFKTPIWKMMMEKWLQDER